METGTINTGDVIALTVAFIALIGSIWPTIMGRRKTGAEATLLTAQAWNEALEALETQQRQITELSAEIMRMHNDMRDMKIEHERRIELYEAQISSLKREYETKIRNLQRRIRELENGNGKG